MEKHLLQLKKMLAHHKKMHNIYKRCNNKTFCGGNLEMKTAYNISRIDEYNNVLALRFAIKIIRQAKAKRPVTGI